MKRLKSGLMAIALVLGLAACGTTENAAPSPSPAATLAPGTTPAVETVTPGTAQQPSEAPGDTPMPGEVTDGDGIIDDRDDSVREDDSVGGNMGDAAREAGDAVGDAAEDVGDAAGEVARGAGDAVGNMTDGTQNAE